MGKLFLMVDINNETIEIESAYDKWDPYSDYESQKDDYFIKVYLTPEDKGHVLFVLAKKISSQITGEGNVKEFFYIYINEENEDESKYRIDLIEEYKHYRQKMKELGLPPSIVLLEEVK